MKAFQLAMMSYETISVRMNRSDTSIRWGFTLGQHGNKIVVATVDRESLSDKAGMKPGDEVDSICGRDAHNMSINDANSIVFTAHQEIHFNLRRYVTTHTCLPWTLTEKDNKLFVDEVQPGFGTGFGTGSEDEYRSSSANYKSLDSSNQQRSIPIQYQPNYQSNFSSHNSTRGTHNGSYVVNNSQPRVYHSPSTYSRHAQSDHTKTTTQGATVQGTSNIQPHSVSSTQNFTSVPSDNNVNHSIATVGNSSNLSSMYNMKHASEQYSTSDNAPPAAQNYSYNNGVTTTAYKPSSGGIPLNQTAFIQTSQHSPLQHSSAVSPRGTRVYYHSPSDRTRRSLSPHASVQHLQYNTPVNLYSTESAAEQYKMQTGRPIE
ncbi:hypothetical protein Angca_001673, partial [Angiostrongylus cantonensis]